LISVLTAASSAVSRAGLMAMIEELPGFTAAGSTSGGELVEQVAELRPDAILWQLSADEDPVALRRLQCPPVILLTANAASGLIRAGARGVLPLEASAEQIRIAIEAALVGLAVFSPNRLNRPADKAGSSHLTARETEVLRMIADGLANKEIAWKLGISEHTVKFHVSAVLGKLGAASRAEAVGTGIRQGVIML
jgi:DNA-binding NarL/FixJ family response regulator